MNKKGIGEPLEIVSSILLIVVVLIVGIIIFAPSQGSLTYISGAKLGYFQGTWWIQGNEPLINTLIAFLNSKNNEYGDIGNLIASKDEDKINIELKKAEDELKEKTGKSFIISIDYIDENGKFVQLAPIDVNELEKLDMKKPVVSAILPSYDGSRLNIIMQEVETNE